MAVVGLATGAGFTVLQVAAAAEGRDDGLGRVVLLRPAMLVIALLLFAAWVGALSVGGAPLAFIEELMGRGNRRRFGRLRPYHRPWTHSERLGAAASGAIIAGYFVAQAFGWSWPS